MAGDPMMPRLRAPDRAGQAANHVVSMRRESTPVTVLPSSPERHCIAGRLPPGDSAQSRLGTSSDTRRYPPRKRRLLAAVRGATSDFVGKLSQRRGGAARRLRAVAPRAAGGAGAVRYWGGRPASPQRAAATCSSAWRDPTGAVSRVVSDSRDR